MIPFRFDEHASIAYQHTIVGVLGVFRFYSRVCKNPPVAAKVITMTEKIEHLEGFSL